MNIAYRYDVGDGGYTDAPSDSKRFLSVFGRDVDVREFDVPPTLGVVGLPASAPVKTLADGTKLPAVGGVRLHDHRHTFATLQLSAGTHFVQVSKRLGRSTFTLTLDTYGDYIPEQDGGALNTLLEPTAPASSVELPSNVVPLRRRSLIV